MIFDCDTWDQVQWPEWVPSELRILIERFYQPSMGRSPRSYMRSAVEHRAPRFGLEVRMVNFASKLVSGRFVYAWNNIGRLVTARGKVELVDLDFVVSHDCMWRNPEPEDYETGIPQAGTLWREVE